MTTASKSAPLSVWRPIATDTFLVGTPHYPEHVDESYWQRDADRMAAAGFNTVRLAEFANKKLGGNASQARAVALALGLGDGHALLIQGPPGTGKSTTAARRYKARRSSFERRPKNSARFPACRSSAARSGPSPAIFSGTPQCPAIRIARSTRFSGAMRPRNAK